MTTPLTLRRPGALVLVFVTAAFVASGWAAPVKAQGTCMEDDGLVFGPFSCASDPDNARAMHPGVFTWKDTDDVDHEYLMFSEGNNLSLRSLADPNNPNEISRGAFGVGNLGDSDTDLMSYMICDDCRFGMSVFKLATVFFDLGTGDQPDFGDFYKSELLGEIPHGLTFKWGDGVNENQYLVAAGINNYECLEGSGLYLFNSVNPAALTLLDCIYDDLGAPVKLTAGRLLQDDDISNGDPYIWGTNNYNFVILKVTGTGNALRLQFVKKVTETPVVGRGTHLLGFDVNLNAGAFPGSDDGIAVTVFSTEGMRVWRVGDLGNPEQIAVFSADERNTLVSLAYPVVWVGKYNTTGYETTYDLKDPYHPELLHDDFWDTTNGWNQWPCETMQMGSAFTRSGDYLFAGRWEVLQRFDFTQCGLLDIPVAGVTLEHRTLATDVWQALPARVFPGDQLRITSGATGTIDLTEIWLSDDANGDLSVASSSGSPVADPVEYTIPAGGGDGEPSSGYTAHVKATNVSGSNESTAQVLISFDPQAGISFQTTP